MKWRNLQDVLREMIEKKGEIKIETPDGDVYTIKEIDGIKIENLEEDEKTKIKLGDDTYILNKESGWFEIDGKPVIDNMLSIKTTINETPDWKELPPSLPLTKEKIIALEKAIGTAINYSEQRIEEIEKEIATSGRNLDKIMAIYKNNLFSFEELLEEIRDIKV